MSALTLTEAPSLRREAVLSECGLYRYYLTRIWDVALPAMHFVMLNPSTADAAQDDPTIRKCMGFARRNGCGGIAVTNLFAYRATDPKALIAAAKAGTDVAGPKGWAWLDVGTQRRPIAAWGRNAYLPALADRLREVLRRYPGVEWLALDTMQNGGPAHPLMLPYSCSPKPWKAGGR